MSNFFDNKGSKKGMFSSVLDQINNAIKDAAINMDKMSSEELCSQGVTYLKQGDVQRAMKMFMAGAYRLDPACMMQLHDLYASGTTINKDATRAWFWARLSGDHGNMNGDYYTALYYLNGTGVEKDVNKAWSYFERAARKGHQEAERYYGQITYEPPHLLDAVLSQEEQAYFPQVSPNNMHSLKSNPTTYLRYCMHYAHHSDRSNMKNLLGLCYLEGFGTPVDYISAQQCFKVDYRAGNPYAMWNLSKMYALGKGLLMNLPEAIALLDTATQNGHQASNERANLHRSRLTATLDTLNKMRQDVTMLGSNYPNNVSKPMEFYFYKLGALRDDYNSCKQLAYRYYYQQGVQRDYNEALFYLGKAILLHKAKQSQDSLGLEYRLLSQMYALGLGVEKNASLADHFFHIAQGMETSLTKYTSITDFMNKSLESTRGNAYEEGEALRNGYYGHTDIDKAIRCYKLCADKNHSSSCFALIKLYLDGYTVPRNATEAKKYAIQFLNLCNSSPDARKLKLVFDAMIAGIVLDLYNELEFCTYSNLTGQMAMEVAGKYRDMGQYDVAWFCYEAAALKGISNARQIRHQQEIELQTRLEQEKQEAEKRARAEQERRAAEERARLEQEQHEAEERARLEQEQREAEERAHAEQEQHEAEKRAHILSEIEDNEDYNDAPLYDSWLAIKKEVDILEISIPNGSGENSAEPKTMTFEEFTQKISQDQAHIDELLKDPKNHNAQLSPETPPLTSCGSYDKEMAEIRQLVSEKKYDELYELGTNYMDEESRYYNPRLAVVCFKLALQHGNLESLVAFANCFASDTGVPVDMSLAKKIIKRLLELDSPALTEIAQELNDSINEYLLEHNESYEEAREQGEYFDRIAISLEAAHYPEEEWLIYEYYRVASYKKGRNGMILPKYKDKYYSQRVNWEQILEMPWEMYLQSGKATKDVEISALATPAEAGLPDNLDKYFYGMIGMEPVKEQLDKIYQSVKMQLIREQVLRERGEQVAENEKGYNFILLGNPGTGKTTVARIIAQILYDIKVRKSNSFIEVERSKVVSDHVGGTENRMREILEKVNGGTLFIDEAYSLYKEDSGTDFGQEAIDVLMKDMEDHRNSYSVIMAGYKEPMMNMIKNANSGFSSRFTYYMELPDYSDESLIKIAYTHIEKQKFTTEETVDQAIKKCINHDKIDHTFGNARYIRELVNRAIENQSQRLTKQGSYDTEELFLLKAVDFWQGNMKEDTVENYMTQLNALTGLQSVKEEVNSLIRLITVQKEMERRGLEPTMDFGTLHLAFKGNPGTGKTTVARIIGKLYASLGILKRGDVFVECSRADLVEKYVGQTAQKVKKVVESAMGGVLFIDEAYSLVQGEDDSFGVEAVNTLVSEIENHRQNLIVIFAGYAEELDDFFKHNPGLRSRIPRDLFFADYDLNELYEIALSMIASKKLILTEEAKETLRVSLLRNSMTENFGNARGVRNMIEAIYRRQNVRIAQLLDTTESELSDEALLTVLPEDIN